MAIALLINSARFTAHPDRQVDYYASKEDSALSK